MISTVPVKNTVLAILACALASCATVDATTKQDIGAPRLPRSDPARVEILRVEPQRAHNRLGDIVVDASTNPALPIEKVEAKLRDEAAKLGADAVVVVYDRVRPTAAYVSGPLWDRSIETVQGRKVSAWRSGIGPRLVPSTLGRLSGAAPLSTASAVESGYLRSSTVSLARWRSASASASI